MTQTYSSETRKVRHLVEKYCKGFGCDVGFGGDKIMKENCLGIDMPTPYTHVGPDKVDIGCKVQEGIPYESNTMDYVYSSHLIEDFSLPDLHKVLGEFVRLVKSNGYLVLVFPHEKTYRARCEAANAPRNLAHKHTDFGIPFVCRAIKRVRRESGFAFDYTKVFSSDREIDYNCVLVFQIRKPENKRA